MRRLAEACDLGAVVAEALDARLSPDAPWPVAVGVSGGGDSMALLLAASAWAKGRGRRVLALNVDHRLQAQSADWARRCGEVAARLGVEFQPLAWEGEKPRTGISAAARQARHRLLAQAARAAGARVILLGHTADDLAEAAAMRAGGSTTPDPRIWAPSPVWPEGRGIFLLRPMLDLGRAAIRNWLAAHGESWIEDPANSDARYARARARLEGAGWSLPPLPKPPDVTALAQACQGDAAGVLAIAREVLRQAAPQAAARFAAIACLCAAGGSRPPRTDRLARLVEALRGAGAVAATLAGARVEADAEQVRFMREAGRGGLASLSIGAGETAVWDGRFEATARRDLEVRPLLGDAKRLDKISRDRLKAVTPGARGALPAIDDGKDVACPALGVVDGVSVTPLVHARLVAAAGLVEQEPN